MTLPSSQTFALLASSLDSEAELQVLSGLLPESRGGLGLLAMGLLSADTRQAVDRA